MKGRGRPAPRLAHPLFAPRQAITAMHSREPTPALKSESADASVAARPMGASDAARVMIDPCLTPVVTARAKHVVRLEDDDAATRVCGAGNSAISSATSVETGSFASPPRGGFALAERSKASSRSERNMSPGADTRWRRPGCDSARG